eukprot:m.170362 g.170362  ORF g.170362 m.170362 type:complete len:52 (-) comp14528_c0_seq4:368-523(-)
MISEQNCNHVFGVSNNEIMQMLDWKRMEFIMSGNHEGSVTCQQENDCTSKK